MKWKVCVIVLMLCVISTLNVEATSESINVPFEFYGPFWDINHDGLNNYLDVSSLVSHYGDTTTPRPPRDLETDRWDINGDGEADYLDVSALVSTYGNNWLGE